METKITDEDILHYLLLKSLYRFGIELLKNVREDLFCIHPSSDEGKVDFKLFYENLKTQYPDQNLRENSTYFEEIYTKKKEADLNSLSFEIEVAMFKNSALDKYTNQFALDKDTNQFALDKDIKKLLWTEIKGIIDIRNKCFHERSFTKEEYENCRVNVIDHIHKICKIMGQISNIFGKYEKIYGNVIENMQKNSFDRNSWSVFKGKKKNDSYGNEIKRWRSDLSKVYKKLNPPSVPENLYFSPQDLFIPIPLSVNSRSIGNEAILQKEKMGKNSIIILSGDAGHGKTVLCNKLLLEWSQNLKENLEDQTVSLTDYDLVLYIEVKSAEELCLVQYLKEVLLPDLLGDRKEHDIIQFLRELQVLIIIDDFDKKSETAHKLIKNTLDILDNQKFLITIRSKFEKDLTAALSAFSYKECTVKIQKFDEKIIENYIDKFFEVLKKNNIDCGQKSSFLSYVNNNILDFHEMFEFPLIYYVYVNLNGKINFNEKVTTTNCFKNLIDHQKKMINSKNFDVFDIVITITGKYFLDKKNARIDSLLIENIKKECEKNGMHSESEFERVLSTFFSPIPCLRNESNKHKSHFGQYDFLFKNQKEFILAYYIISKLSVEEYVATQKFNIKENLILFKFIIGLLDVNKKKLRINKKKVEDILKENDLSDDFNTVWKLSSEILSQKSNWQSSKVIESHILSNTKWNLTETDVVSGLKTIYNSHVKVKCLEICIDSSCEPFDIPQFIETLKNLGNVEKNPKIDISLCLERHLLKKGIIKSDDILLYFKSWSNIKVFSGFLAKPGIKSLGSFQTLEDIAIKILKFEDLEELNASCLNKPNLKEIRLIFNEPFPKNSIKKIKKMKEIGKTIAHISISFNIVTPKNGKEMLLMLDALKKRDGKPFKLIKLYLEDNNYAKAKNLLRDFDKELILDRLIIKTHSENTFQVEEKKNLQSLVNYTLDFDD